MTKSERYPNGYLPKIAYWMFRGNLANVRYFIARQEKEYGTITSEDEGTIEEMVEEHRDRVVAMAEKKVSRKTLQELNEFVAERFPNVIGI